MKTPEVNYYSSDNGSSSSSSDDGDDDDDGDGSDADSDESGDKSRGRKWRTPHNSKSGGGGGGGRGRKGGAIPTVRWDAHMQKDKPAEGPNGAINILTWDGTRKRSNVVDQLTRCGHASFCFFPLDSVFFFFSIYPP